MIRCIVPHNLSAISDCLHNDESEKDSAHSDAKVTSPKRLYKLTNQTSSVALANSAQHCIALYYTGTHVQWSEQQQLANQQHSTVKDKISRML
jgi:hypothetical protein